MSPLKAPQYDPEWLAFTEAMGKPALPESLEDKKNMVDTMLTAMQKKLPPSPAGVTSRIERINLNAYDHASNLGADVSRYLVWGGSAGGALALGVVYRLIQSNQGDRVRGLVLMAPALVHPDAVPEQYQHLFACMTEFGDDVPFVKPSEHYVATELAGIKPPYNDESKHWLPVSLGAEAMKGMPPKYIINAEIECMRDDGAVLKAELRDVCVPVMREVMAGLPHYFWSFPLEKAGEIFRQNLVDGFKWVLEN